MMLQVLKIWWSQLDAIAAAAAIASGIAGSRYAGWAIKTALTVDATTALSVRQSQRAPSRTRTTANASDSDDILKIAQRELDDNPEMLQGVSWMSLMVCVLGGLAFVNHSLQMAPYLSEPQVIVRIPEKSSTSSEGSVDSSGQPKKPGHSTVSTSRHVRG